MEDRPNSSEIDAERVSPKEIDAKVLADIGNLGLRARVVAESALAGLHRSRNHGTSVEFAEHKEYSPGDNVRHLDWRAFARLDRDFIKRYEDEASLRSLMVVDSSGSMGYPKESPDGRLNKLEYANTCAGALAYVLSRQGDAAGLASYSEKLRIEVPPRARRGHLQEILANLEKLKAEGPSKLGEAISNLSDGLNRRTILVIFSDLLDGGLEALSAVARLRAQRHDVVLFHILDPDELDFPFEESTLFESMEDDQSIQIDARAIKQAYLEEMNKFKRSAEQKCRAARVEYIEARTDLSPGRLLAQFLSRRGSMQGSVR